MSLKYSDFGKGILKEGKKLTKKRFNKELGQKYIKDREIIKQASK